MAMSRLNYESLIGVRGLDDSKAIIQEWLDHGEVVDMNLKIGTDMLPEMNTSMVMRKDYYINKEANDLGVRILKNKNARAKIKDVKFCGPATIVWFYDYPGIQSSVKKVVVKCQEGDVYDKEKGLLAAIAKYYMGGPVYNDVLKKWCQDEN